MKNIRCFHRLYIVFSGLSLIFLLSCAEKQPQSPPLPEIPVVKVIEKDVPVYKEFVGQVYGQQDIPIRARVSGFLQGIHFTEGGKVKKGDLLYSIDEQPFQAEVARQMSALAEAKTSMVKAHSDLKRIVPLAEVNAVSQSDLDAAQAQYDAAVAYVDAAKASLEIAKINLGYCKIYAPIDGIIGKTQAKAGEFVGQMPNPVILNTVSAIDSVRVEFFLSESDYLNLYDQAKEMSEKEVKRTEDEDSQGGLELILADGRTFGHKGKVDFIDRQVDPTTGAILIQATFPNPERILRPGFFARVRAKLFDARDALLVPQRTVTDIQGVFSVYKVNEEHKIVFQIVEPGPVIGDMWIITKGVQKEDVIVLEGVQHIREGQAIVPVLKAFESKSEILKD